MTRSSPGVISRSAAIAWGINGPMCSRRLDGREDEVSGPFAILVIISASG